MLVARCSYLSHFIRVPLSMMPKKRLWGGEKESEKRVEEKLKIYNRFDGYETKIQVSCELYRAAVCTLQQLTSERGDVPLLLPLLLLRWKINKLK